MVNVVTIVLLASMLTPFNGKEIKSGRIDENISANDRVSRLDTQLNC